MYEKPSVNLIAVTRGLEDELLGPEELSAFGAYGCFEKETSLELFRKKKEEDEYKIKSGEGTAFPMETLVESILEKSDGIGHCAVSDQNHFIYSIKDLPRVSTLVLCEPEYLSHLQQSLRRATADRGFYLPKEIEKSSLFEETKKVLQDSFSFYQKAIEKKIPKEDARNPLPLYTKTNIQTAGNARALRHLRKMAQQDSVPSIVKYTVEEMIKQVEELAPKLFKETAYNYETLGFRPSSQLFAKENKTMNKIINKYDYPKKPVLLSYSGIEIDEEQIKDAVENRNEAELANLKHIHFEFLAPMSLSCFHQATRQRTWNQSVESVYDAAKKRQTVTPPTIKKKGVLDEYNEQNERMFDLYDDLLSEGIPMQEAVGVLPHSLQIYDLIHVDGWNGVYSIGKRTCEKAQWEIRGIANKIAKDIKRIHPDLGKYAEPQCVNYGKCPEREPCGYLEAYLKSHRP